MTEFSEKVKDLANRSKTAQRQALTEEATKTAVIYPFIQALGFDIFNLDEVVPEVVADVGIKKGEKIDLAIKINGNIAILIEVKSINRNLGYEQFSQLFRYFSVMDTRLAILTNGQEAWFYSDTERPNKMDSNPFFIFDFQKHDKAQVQELSRFQKENFSIDGIIEAASNLKYTKRAVNFLKKQIADPDEDFVHLVGRQIYDGTITRNVVEQIKPAIQAALDEIFQDRTQDKLSITLQDTKILPTETTTPVSDSDENSAPTRRRRRRRTRRNIPRSYSR